MKGEDSRGCQKPKHCYTSTLNLNCCREFYQAFDV